MAAAKSQVAAPSKADEAAGDSADHTPRAVGAQQFLGECAARLPANQLITLNLKDANIQTTLRLFAQQYRVNVLSTDDVKGTITLDFFRVPAREAFQKIIDTGNLRCAMTGEILRVSMVAQSKEVTAPPTRAWAAPLSRATSTPALATSTAEATAAARSTGQPTPFPAPQQPTLQAGRPPEPPVPAEYHAGLNAAEAKDWLGAERAYRDALQKSPSNPEIWYKLGVALGQQKRRSDAIAAYREALRLNTGHVNSWYNLGLELSRERGYAAALAAFTEVTRLEPTNARGWKIRGSLHTMNKEFPQAISALHEAIRLKPDDAETWYDLTYLHVLTSNPRAATEAYARLMQLDPAKAGQFRKEVLLAGTATTPAPQSSVDRQELSPTTR